ncbi:amidohydrolase [Sandaracinomonas limnophila]|uniref:Amidohydrolase n=1 Tax=Sandaracinomonas limnophila TaxID=1862386 RepID=A0A437PWC7_9BACT|nr:amidohydrolase family protein [Sandaracinomonas limnophila]RVU26551.1 amidohydrolase [Sandaracinomonas limnophila]
MKKLILTSGFFMSFLFLKAQETLPINGIRDVRSGTFVFTNATIITQPNTKLEKASILIKQGKIVAIGTQISIPTDAQVIDSKGRFIYPSFIDAYTDYGSSSPQNTGRSFNWGAPAQFKSNKPGAFAWNQALHPEINVVEQFSADENIASNFRSNGFGTVFTHLKDGIIRGTGAVVSLGKKNDQLLVLKAKAAQVFSFDKGTSTQSYPTSLMGSIALLRQTYLDAKWYQTKPLSEGLNLSLEAFNSNQSIPQIFLAGADKWAAVRADKIGDEFGVQYIIRGGESGYQRIAEIQKTKASYILDLDFPSTPDVEDPTQARLLSLADMRHWELAATNPGVFEKNNISFALTQDMKDSKSFLSNLKKAISLGLSESKALEALTKTPAQMLGVYDQVGSLEVGKLANFIITDSPIFSSKAKILENWIAGDKFTISSADYPTFSGKYTLKINESNYQIELSKDLKLKVIGKDTLDGKASFANNTVTLSFAASKTSNDLIRLNGNLLGSELTGTGFDATGQSIVWNASKVSEASEKKSEEEKQKSNDLISKITYPFMGYGNEVQPAQETILIKNATVWTNEKDGILSQSDVLLKAGKIQKIGKNISEAGAKIIDGTGKHLTAGIIDEHSHIATVSINEGAQSVTSEVRIGDNLDPEDINIYRQLSGGVTSSHILHGSANTIGGQTQLIKLRWGTNDEGLKFQGADPFIKFALGENVKRTTSMSNNRYPDTRMGVEEVLVDAFDRAAEYDKNMKANPLLTRRDLELDALVEIMNKKRFITCHSYVQPEITYTMRVVENMKKQGYDFNINTFTHILEGYKVADKMKAHGANVSTFSDWYMYKTEVQDAIAYNAAIMYNMGLNVCINSDDAEMARRLNQEAGKTVKYGNVPEVDALKMVTLNPAKALHVDSKVGSIKVGKDADVVLWTDNPLSIYAKSLYTIVDGVVYFDREKDAQMRVKISEERNALVQKMLNDKKSGAATKPVKPSGKALLLCSDHDEQDENHTHESQTIE